MRQDLNSENRLNAQLYYMRPGWCPQRSLARLLVELYAIEELQWLARALLLPASVWIEEGWKDTERSSNPLDFDAHWGGQADHHLSELLVQGKGASGSSETAVFPEQHSRSFTLLRKRHKLWGKKKRGAPLQVASSRRCMLVRYRQASLDHFKQCQCISVALDGSRIGGKEVVLFMLTGTNAQGVTLSAWAPPQAPTEKKN